MLTVLMGWMEGLNMANFADLHQGVHSEEVKVEILPKPVLRI